MAKWSGPEHSRKAVNRAGEILVANNPDPSNFEIALEVVNNWRSSHAFPLNTFQMALRKRARRHDSNAIIAQRIKRRESIEAKLRREPNMALSQMQDIGGCRAVVKDLDCARYLVGTYMNTDKYHERTKHDNYIAKPQKSGYRGFHVVYKYRTRHIRNKSFDGLRIEVQIRTRLQHLWATAVETVGTFTNQALKASYGDKDWLRFFSLTGSATAMLEGTNLVPNTPDNEDELREEIKRLALSVDAFTKFDAYQFASNQISRPERKDGKFYLLRIDVKNRRLKIEAFTENQPRIASERYYEVERAAIGQEGIDVVLVAADTIRSLRRAYPNYFADTRDFTSYVQRFIDGAS